MSHNDARNKAIHAKSGNKPRSFVERVEKGLKDRKMAKKDLSRLMSTKYDS